MRLRGRRQVGDPALGGDAVGTRVEARRWDALGDSGNAGEGGWRCQALLVGRMWRVRV